MQNDDQAGGGPKKGEGNLPAPLGGRASLTVPNGYGYGTGAYANGEASDDIDLAQLLRRLAAVAWKWRFLILGTAGIFFALGLVYCFLATPLYSATVRIQIDREPGKILDGGVTGPTEVSSIDFQKTQYELLKSRGMSERVVSVLALDKTIGSKAESPGLLGALLGLFASEPTEEDQRDLANSARKQAIETVQRNVSIRPVSGSRLVDIVYTDPSASQAASITNAYAEAYVASNLDKRFEASAYAKVFLEDQLKQLKLRLEESEKAVIAFAERENMVQTNDKVSIAESNLAAANAALGTLVSNRIRDEQIWRQVENSTAINLPQLLSNNVIDGLRVQRNELRREYEQNLQTFKPGYPAMVEISKKIAETDRQLDTEVATVRNALRASYESALSQEEEMRKQIEMLRTEVIDLQKKSVRYGILQREVDSSRNLYNSLLQRYKEVDVASGVNTNNIFIIDRALPPDSPSHPRTVLILAGSVILGLMVGFGGANLIELFDNRIRTPDDAEKASGLPILGLVPKTDHPEGLLQELGNPRSGMAEAYRSLATSLQFATDSGLPRTIVVTSGGPAEGKSTTAIALARHFAVIGKKVLLVDADLRRPSLHTKLEMSNGVGLTNVITGTTPLDEAAQTTAIDNLWFIASGPLPPNAAEILGGTNMFSFLALGQEMFDLIIIDSPPMLGLADAQLLGAAASATIFVMGSGQARRGLVQNAMHRLRLARAQPIGVILTKLETQSAGYGYGYGYGYHYGYGLEEEEGGLRFGDRKLKLPDFIRRGSKSNSSESEAI